MPHYCWMCPDGKTVQGVDPRTGQMAILPDQRVAGCVERLCCYTPFIKPGQMMHPQTRQMVQVAVPDEVATWTWINQSSGQRLSPGADYQCVVTNPARGKGGQPSVYCVQTTEPSVVREQVNAPTMQPVGNAGSPVGPAPLPGQPRTVPFGAFEQLPDPALPGYSDPVMGDIDAAGGTYTDIDASTGQEVRREMYRQSAIPTAQQIRR